MKPSHPKYKIKQGDTIQSITAMFGVEFDTWKRYHNNMCRLDDIIHDTLPKQLGEIYLLPDLWEKEEALNKEITNGILDGTPRMINFGYDKTLIMMLCPEQFIYKVTIQISNNNHTGYIHYYASVRWVKKENLLYTIEINKFPETYIINGVEADLVADELAIQVASVLYPLELVVTRQDGIVGINNMDEIRKRWVDIKKKVQDYNEGEILEKYLSLTEKALKDEDALLLSLRNDWFLHTYFNSIYQTYTSDYTIDNSIVVPFVFDTEGVEYKVQQKIDKDIDEKGHINISMKGLVSDGRSITDLENKLGYNRYTSESPLVGDYQASYMLEPKYNTIEEVKLNTKLDLEYTKIVDVHIIKIK